MFANHIAELFQSYANWALKVAHPWSAVVTSPCSESGSDLKLAVSCKLQSKQ
jgi:hypothetical protein